MLISAGKGVRASVSYGHTQSSIFSCVTGTKNQLLRNNKIPVIMIWSIIADG